MKSRTRRANPWANHINNKAQIDRILKIEKNMQQLWDKHKVFEANINNNKDKYLCTVPPLSVNKLLLTIGDLFVILKTDFTAGYQRLKGKNVLFPLSFNCSGTKIKKFCKSVDTKLKDYTLTDIEIKQIRKSPEQWMSLVPLKGIKHLQSLGIKCDWRRSFITTDNNPYYNKFVEWQFLKLQQATDFMFFKKIPIPFFPNPKVKRYFGHINIMKFILIKMKLIIDKNKYNNDKLSELFLLNKSIYLVSALQHNIQYFPTDCFVESKSEYIAFITKKDEIFICSEYSANNMCWQEFTNNLGKYHVLVRLKGNDLLGNMVQIPNGNQVRILQSMTVKSNKIQQESKIKRTGILYGIQMGNIKKSAADDNMYQKLIKKGLAEIYWEQNMLLNSLKCLVKYSVDDVDWYLKYGKSADEDEIQNENMYIVNGFIRNIETCFNMNIPNGIRLLVFKSCKYWNNTNKYKNKYHRIINDYVSNHLNCYNIAKRRHVIKSDIDILKEWKCTINYGLGTKLPFDKKHVIDNASDSTICTAFHSISNYLLNNSLNGDVQSNPIDPNELTPKVFDIIFCDGDINQLQLKSKLTKDLILKMKNEFEYFYPIDLITTDKAPKNKYLAMTLYNHSVIWPNQPNKRWPQSCLLTGFYKERRRFLSIPEIIMHCGADAIRFYVCSLGDALGGYSFDLNVVVDSSLRLVSFENHIIEMYELLTTNTNKLRNGSLSEFDQLFLNSIYYIINKTDIAYNNMKFRDVIQFAYSKFKIYFTFYKLHSNDVNMHCKVIKTYINVQLLLLSPICPHITEYLWSIMSHTNGLCVNSSWPCNIAQNEDIIKRLQFQSLRILSSKFSRIYNKMKQKTINSVIVCVAVEYKYDYQKVVLNLLSNIYDKQTNTLTVKDWRKYILANIQNDNQAKYMKFGAHLVSVILPERKQYTFNHSLPYNEYEFLKQNKKILFHGIDLNQIKFYKETDKDIISNKIRQNVTVYEPVVDFIWQ